MRLQTYLAAASAALTAFKRTLETAPGGRQDGPAANDNAGDVEQLQARFRAAQVKAASGTRGAVAARREMKALRHQLLRLGAVA